MARARWNLTPRSLRPPERAPNHRRALETQPQGRVPCRGHSDGANGCARANLCARRNTTHFRVSSRRSPAGGVKSGEDRSARSRMRDSWWSAWKRLHRCERFGSCWHSFLETQTNSLRLISRDAPILGAAPRRTHSFRLSMRCVDSRISSEVPFVRHYVPTKCWVASAPPCRSLFQCVRRQTSWLRVPRGPCFVYEVPRLSLRLRSGLPEGFPFRAFGAFRLQHHSRPTPSTRVASRLVAKARLEPSASLIFHLD